MDNSTRISVKLPELVSSVPSFDVIGDFESKDANNDDIYYVDSRESAFSNYVERLKKKRLSAEGTIKHSKAIHQIRKECQNIFSELPPCLQMLVEDYNHASARKRKTTDDIVVDYEAAPSLVKSGNSSCEDEERSFRNYDLLFDKLEELANKYGIYLGERRFNKSSIIDTQSDSYRAVANIFRRFRLATQEQTKLYNLCLDYIERLNNPNPRIKQAALDELQISEKAARTFLDRLVQLNNERLHHINCIVEGNMLFVVKVVNDIGWRTTVEREEMVSDGMKGLYVAAEKFDYWRGFMFSTCAFEWLYRYIREALPKYRTIVGASMHVVKRFHAVVREKDRLRAVLGREPTSLEIEQQTSCSRRDIEDAFRMMGGYASLNSEVVEKEKQELLGMQYQDIFPDEEDRIGAVDQSKTMKSLLGKAISDLKERDRKVIILRFGLDGRGEQTLESVGQQIGVSNQYVRDLEKKAIKKLREMMMDYREQLVS